MRKQEGPIGGHHNNPGKKEWWLGRGGRSGSNGNWPESAYNRPKGCAEGLHIRCEMKRRVRQSMEISCLS